MKAKTGTREWSEHSVNCCLGCAHGCLYCYARYNALHRFKWIKRGEDWTNERVDVDAANRDRKKYAGVVMFPTTNDLTRGTAAVCLTTLVNLLEAENDVLVVSKAGPHVPALLDMARSFAEGKCGLKLRVSLTCLNGEIARFWEPGAPHPGVRLNALRAARDAGIPISVSIEPLLEPERVRDIVFAAMEAGVGGEIWIGAANKLRQRTAWIDHALGATGEPSKDQAAAMRIRTVWCRDLWGNYVGPHRDWLLNHLVGEIARIEAGQTPEAMRRIYESLKDNPQIRWKDSYQKALGIDAMGRAARD